MGQAENTDGFLQGAKQHISIQWLLSSFTMITIWRHIRKVLHTCTVKIITDDRIKQSDKITQCKNKWCRHLKIFNRAGIFFGTCMQKENLQESEWILEEEKGLMIQKRSWEAKQIKPQMFAFLPRSERVKYGKVCPGLKERSMYWTDLQEPE